MAPRREYLYFVEPKDDLGFSELDRQAEFIRAMEATDEDLVDVFAVPNGSRRTRWQQAQAKLEGLKGGVSDLVISWDGGILFAEFKNGTEMPRKDQHDWLNQKIRFGFNAGVFRTAACLLKHLKANGAPLSRMTMTFAE